MKIKRLAALAVAVTLSIALAACRGSRASDGASDSGQTPQPGGASGANPLGEGQRTLAAPGGGLDQAAGPTSRPGGNKPTGGDQAGPAITPPGQGEPTQVASPEPTQPPPQPSPTEQPIEKPTEVVFEAKGGSAESLKGAWEKAYELPPGVPFSVTTTEAEIEAMINERMASSGHGDKISNLNVKLDNGQIAVSFTLTVSQQIGPKKVDISADGTVIFAASIDSSGQLALTIVSADFGKISVPPEMLEPLSEAISQAITGASAGAQADVTLTSLVIEDGAMTVKGYVKPK